MKAINLRSLQLALIAAAAGLSACKAKHTYVHVKILPAAAGEPVPITDVELQLDLAGKTESVHLADPGHAALQLPTDVTLEVKTGSGQLAILAIARNAAGAEVDRGAATAQVSSGAIAEAAVQLPGGKPDLRATESTHDFGSVLQGTTSTAISLSFVNAGFRPSGPVSVAIDGVGASSWQRTADTCNGSTLAPGATCAVSVRFSPGATGQLAATLTASATPGGAAAVALTGAGAPSVAISVTITGTGSGAISDGIGNSCNTGTSPCTFMEPLNGTVTLTATPDPGSAITGGSGDPCDPASAPGTCIYPNITTPKSVSLVYSPNILTVSTNGTAGSVSSADGKISGCGDLNGICNATYNWNDPVTLNAVEAPGTAFASWSGGACGGSTTTPCTLTMSQPTSVVANFDYLLTVTITGGGTGTISCSTDGGATSGPCASHYPANSTVILSATADTTAAFNGWAGGGCTGTGPCTVTMTAGTLITATFTSYTVTVAKTGTGSITASDPRLNCDATCTSVSAPFAPGSNVALTASPGAGFLFTGYSGCTTTDGKLSCSVSNLAADVTVTAPFEASLCADTVAYGQAFGTAMQGCAGAVPYTNASGPDRASLCGASAHVCNSDDWVRNSGGVAPTHHYWTDDNLNYSGSGCGPAGCNTQSCWVTTGTANAFACTAGNGPMRVCAGATGGAADPENNTCTWTGCGFNSLNPNQHFGGCSGPNDKTAGTLCCSNAALHFHYVNVATGLDTNAGTSGAPFKTITHALGVAAAGDTVYVAPGAYTVGSGETFPISIPAAVNLIGDEPNRGAPPASAATTISGSGTDPLNPGGPQPAVIAADNSTLAGFTVTGNYGVVPSGFGVTIRNNTLTGNSNDALHADSAHGVKAANVLLNLVSNNPTGMAFSGVSAKVENNTVTGNAVTGVQVFGNPVDLGGGSFSSVGNNALICTRLADLLVDVAVPASNNQWDHATPTSAAVNVGNANGVDIDINGAGGSVDATGSTRSASACPAACPTSVSSFQQFDGSMNGCGGKVPFASRANLCPSYCHVCSAAEWNTHRGAIVPNQHYWTNDDLGYNNSSQMTGSCSVVFPSPTFLCESASEGPMLVCAPGVAGKPSIDANGNQCNLFNCGFNTTTNQYFGGCSNFNTGGSLCCCP